MRMIRILGAALLMALLASPVAAEPVRLKDLGRFLGWRDNALVGYGVVSGLSGSGDSPHSALTQRALSNALSRLGANVSPDQLQSRNVAAVLVTASLPPSANVGDKIDVSVSSIGDARSLAGGTLLMTPLVGPDQQTYALAQGALVVGGYRFDSSLNGEQKNYPTSAIAPGGATVELAVRSNLLNGQNDLTFILNNPDFTTAERVRERINAALGPDAASVIDASAVRIHAGASAGNLFGMLSRVESITVEPDVAALVVINERTGTVVSGGDVQISSVVISQGDIRVSVSMDNQQSILAAPYGRREDSRRGLVVANTKLEVHEPSQDATVRFPNTTVADLIAGLARVHVDTRGMIAVLQAIKAAGAMHAEIIVQ